MVLIQGMPLVSIGLLIGIGSAFWLTAQLSEDCGPFGRRG